MLKSRSTAKEKKRKQKTTEVKIDKRKKLKGALEIFCLLGKHAEKCSFNGLLSSSNAASSSILRQLGLLGRSSGKKTRLLDLKFWLTTR